jgi:hypothetical protein
MPQTAVSPWRPRRSSKRSRGLAPIIPIRNRIPRSRSPLAAGTQIVSSEGLPYLESPLQQALVWQRRTFTPIQRKERVRHASPCNRPSCWARKAGVALPEPMDASRTRRREEKHRRHEQKGQGSRNRNRRRQALGEFHGKRLAGRCSSRRILFLSVL